MYDLDNFFFDSTFSIYLGTTKYEDLFMHMPNGRKTPIHTEHSAAEDKNTPTAVRSH
jgi:hypothetical protein